MKSTRVEFARFRNLGIGYLREGDEYLRTVADLPVQAVRMAIDQRPFDKLMRKLRYGAASEQDRRDAMRRVCALSTEFLGLGRDPQDSESRTLASVLAEGKENLQQLDLVANAAELSALPFEAALDADGNPLFLNGGGVVLTRRVRGRFNEESPAWPLRPRVLFVWSEAGGRVPHEQHREILSAALDPWLSPGDEASVLVEVGNARLADVEAAVTRAGPGFSHVHLLAHGHPLRDEDDDRFGIAFEHPIEGMDVVTPEALTGALAAIRSSAVVVTLAACDAANQTDSITPGKSIAHELHVSGLPVVVASQLPLTVAGSTILVRHFYADLFTGLDLRTALHRVRKELYEQQASAGHDWLSLVGYVELREGYADFLEEVRLKSQLAALENLGERVVGAVQAGGPDEVLGKLRGALQDRITALKQLLLATGKQSSLEENLGLLGSAEKRLAELWFHQSAGEAKGQESRRALQRARDWYRQAFDADPAHHWSGVQFLAIDAALTGKLDAERWTTAYRAAEVDRRRPRQFWAQCSLAELALLDRMLGAGTDLPAEAYLVEMMGRVQALSEPPAHDPIKATTRQLARYVHWWRQELGFFPGAPDLAGEAARLIAFIDKHGPGGA